MSREVRAARVEIEKGVDHLARSVVDIQMALRRAERKIEGDAHDRIRKLRREARAKLAVLRARRREATRTLGRLSNAAGGSWRDVKRAADRTLTDARSVAESVIERFRRAVQEGR
jgi:predicted transposase YdaD